MRPQGTRGQALGLALALLPAGAPARAQDEEPASSAQESLTLTTWQRAKAVRTRAPELPDPDQRLAMTELVTDLLRAAPSGRVPAGAVEAAEALGLQVETDGKALWLYEGRADGRGDGLFAVHLGPLERELVLQAPHPISDQHTGAIVGRIFDDSLLRADPAPGLAVRAVVIATAHRAATEASDPSRQPELLFQAATDALDLALVDPLVVQIHGFDPQTSPADGVVSDGMARSGGRLEARARSRLAVAMGLPDLRGPEEVPELAAMKNVQARLLADRVRFLHLELSADLRDRIRNEAEARLAFRLALQDLAGRTPAEPRPPAPGEAARR